MNQQSVLVRCVPLALWITALLGAPVFAQARLVTVTVPAGVTFQVTNVGTTTTGTPVTTIAAVNPINFKSNDELRISVRADAADFTPPPGSTAIPASAVSWTATSPNGTPMNGTLSASSYRTVFESSTNFTGGTVVMTWYLAPVSAAGLRSGAHNLTVRWRFQRF